LCSTKREREKGNDEPTKKISSKTEEQETSTMKEEEKNGHRWKTKLQDWRIIHFGEEMEDEKTVGKKENQTWRWRNHKLLTTIYQTNFTALSVTLSRFSHLCNSFNHRFSISLAFLSCITPTASLSYSTMPYVDFLKKKEKKHSLTATSGSERSC